MSYISTKPARIQLCLKSHSCFHCGKPSFHLPLPESPFNVNLLPTQALETQAPHRVTGGIYLDMSHTQRARSGSWHTAGVPEIGSVSNTLPLGGSYRNADGNSPFFLPFNNEILPNFLKKISTFYMSDCRIKMTASHGNLVQPVVSTIIQISLDVCLILNVCILFHNVPTLT